MIERFQIYEKLINFINSINFNYHNKYTVNLFHAYVTPSSHDHDGPAEVNIKMV